MDNSEVFHKAEQIRDVIRYLRLFKGSTAVVHIDDTIIDSPYFASHIRDLCLIQEAGLKIIIVPGARKRINEILNQANISWQMENSCRITDEKAMPLIKMAAFDVSNRVMTSFAAEKRTAVIGNWVRARGKGINLGVDYGTAGEIDKIQVEAVNSVLDNGFIPIFPCIGWSISGKPYNISSSQLATALAVKMKADKLFFLTQNTTINAENFVIPPNSTFIKEKSIPAMNLQEVSSFISLNESAAQTFENDKKDFVLQTLSLLRMALSACRAGVSRVHILNGSFNGTLPCEIFSDFGSGTMIYEDNYGGIRGMELDDIPDILNLIRPFVEEKILLPRTENDLIEQYKDYIGQKEKFIDRSFLTNKFYLVFIFALVITMFLTRDGGANYYTAVYHARATGTDDSGSKPIYCLDPGASTPSDLYVYRILLDSKAYEAEDTGLIIPLGNWVLKEALRRLTASS